MGVEGSESDGGNWGEPDRDGDEGVGGHSQGGAAVPGGPPARLMLVQAGENRLLRDYL